jgi:flagellar basal body rod protein FlgB
MTFGFIHRVSSATSLKEALDAGAQRTREIAERVARSSLGNQDGFALPSNALVQDALGVRQRTDVDLENEMTNLADAQLRFEATSKLLSKAYAQIRTSLRDR